MRAKGTPTGAGATAAQPASNMKIRDRPRFPALKTWSVPDFDSDAVGLSKQRKRMGFFRVAFIAAFPAVFPYPLHDMPGGDRAVRAHIVGTRFRHAAEHRAADLHRVVEVLGLHAPGAVVACAALDGGDGGARKRLQQIPGLLSPVLHAR